MYFCNSIITEQMFEVKKGKFTLKYEKNYKNPV
jgi:hypothetical protein